MRTKVLKRCPWKWTRWSPSRMEMNPLFKRVLYGLTDCDSILEFGCGQSTWYLYQCGFKDYTAVETYEPNMVKVKEVCPNVNIVDKWTDIPSIKYKCVFVDSKEGGGVTGRWVREKPLIYALDNNLIDDNAVIIVHDYKRIKQGTDGNLKWRKRLNGWITTMENYNWEISHEIMVGRGFGVYRKI